MAQSKMAATEQLINTTDQDWIVVKAIIDSAKNHIEVLPTDTLRANTARNELKMSGLFFPGAGVLHTGGILVDHGWIRIIGSGSKKFEGAIMEWHRKLHPSQNPGYIVVADDAIGGFFLLNNGGLGDDLGKIYYFSRYDLEFKPMHLDYRAFLIFCFNDDLDRFYQGYRWKSWKKDIQQITASQAFGLYPAHSSEKNKRTAVRIEDQYISNLDIRKKLGLDKPDTIGHE